MLFLSYKLATKLNKFLAYKLDAETGNLEIIFGTSNIFGFLAIFLAAINIFGGFLVTQRMLQMYKKKKKNK